MQFYALSFHRAASRPCRLIFLASVLLALLCHPLLPAWSQEPSKPSPDQAVQGPSPTEAEAACSPEELRLTPKVAGYKTICLNPSIPEIQYLREYWDDIESRHDPEKVYGNNITILKPPVLKQWRNLVSMYPTLTPEKKLQFVNGFFNRWPSASDLTNYGKDEYWSTPEEFLENGGDCEDFAIVKYFALRHFSWPVDDMWILLVSRKSDGEKHALLMARTKMGLFMLDNLSKPGYLLILAEPYLKSFTPLFALNERGVWMFVEKVAVRNGNDSDRNKKSAAATSQAKEKGAVSTVLKK